jgi:hypothetical protein
LLQGTGTQGLETASSQARSLVVIVRREPATATFDARGSVSPMNAIYELLSRN